MDEKVNETKMQDMMRWQAFLKEDGSGIDARRGSTLAAFDLHGVGETYHFDAQSTIVLLKMIGLAVEVTAGAQEKEKKAQASAAQAGDGPTV